MSMKIYIQGEKRDSRRLDAPGGLGVLLGGPRSEWMMTETVQSLVIEKKKKRTICLLSPGPGDEPEPGGPGDKLDGPAAGLLGSDSNETRQSVKNPAE
jgi:hypothetical protein